jgi:hypothetical protein
METQDAQPGDRDNHPGQADRRGPRPVTAARAAVTSIRALPAALAGIVDVGQDALDDMGHHMELGRIPEEGVARACGVIDSLAITGEAVRPVLAAQLQAFLTQSGIRLENE